MDLTLLTIFIFFINQIEYYNSNNVIWQVSQLKLRYVYNYLKLKITRDKNIYADY